MITTDAPIGEISNILCILWCIIIVPYVPKNRKVLGADLWVTVGTCPHEYDQYY